MVALAENSGRTGHPTGEKAKRLIAMHIAQAIKELGTVPEGLLYAYVMNALSLESFRSLMQAFVNFKIIRIDHHLIKWIGGNE